MYSNIRGDTPGRGRQTRVGMSRTANFSVFAGCFLILYEASFIIWRYADRRRLSSDPKIYDLE